ncbi:MAG TPA: hypothetical protein VG755_33025 [Nannocystaceae bacterium]|nr:hypothetical protein [Nannocystaceae bacterium]
MNRRVALLIALGELACRPTISIGSNETSTSSSDGSTSSSTTTTSTTTGDLDGSSTGAPDPDTTGFGHEGESGFGPPPSCHPEPYDSFCVACAKDACCGEFAACIADFGCGCALGCLQYPGPYPCGCPPHPLAEQLKGCLDVSCDPVCVR